jgi:hypothetical protein
MIVYPHVDRLGRASEAGRNGEACRRVDQCRQHAAVGEP